MDKKKSILKGLNLAIIVAELFVFFVASYFSASYWQKGYSILSLELITQITLVILSGFESVRRIRDFAAKQTHQNESD